MKDKIIFVLLIVFYRYNINLIGEISISALYIIGTSFGWFKHINLRNPLLQNILKWYIVLIFTQFILGLVLDNDWLNLIKGLAITIVSLFSFWFFFLKFYQHISYVKLFLLGEIISLIIWPNVLSDIEGSEFGYYKFTLVPLLSNLILLGTIVPLFNKHEWIKKNISLLICYSGAFFILTGARSSGLIMFLVGAIGFCINHSKNITSRGIYKTLALAIVIGYTAYALVYVPQVMSGKLDKIGNSAQLKKADNPYNPISLLLTGRIDSFIPLLAFVDKPLTGYGYRAKDPDMKYHRLLYSFNDKTIGMQNADSTIPTHSVLFGYAASYGILGLILVSGILFIILHKGIQSLKYKNKFLYIKIFFMYNIIWHSLFSPMTHMRLSLPVMLAFLLAIYLKEQRIAIYFQTNNEKRHIGNNCHLRQ